MLFVLVGVIGLHRAPAITASLAAHPVSPRRMLR
jgi:hypothetical protein